MKDRREVNPELFAQKPEESVRGAEVAVAALK